VTVWRPSVCPSLCPIVGILTVTHQGSAWDAASVHFRPTTRNCHSVLSFDALLARDKYLSDDAQGFPINGLKIRLRLLQASLNACCNNQNHTIVIKVLKVWRFLGKIVCVLYRFCTVYKACTSVFVFYCTEVRWCTFFLVLLCIYEHNGRVCVRETRDPNNLKTRKPSLEVAPTNLSIFPPVTLSFDLMSTFQLDLALFVMFGFASRDNVVCDELTCTYLASCVIALLHCLVAHVWSFHSFKNCCVVFAAFAE